MSAPPHQVGSDTQVLPDGVLFLSRQGRVHPLLLPLPVNLPHGILRNFGKDQLSSVMLLSGWKEDEMFGF